MLLCTIHFDLCVCDFDYYAAERILCKSQEILQRMLGTPGRVGEPTKLGISRNDKDVTVVLTGIVIPTCGILHRQHLDNNKESRIAG
jgi:hypothetical protein